MKRPKARAPSVRVHANRRERRRQDSEARILRAAEQVFAETGFSGATTADIAAKARLPKANVHYYFGTKERLYRRVLKRILDAWLASGDSIRPEADPATAFADYIAAKVEASQRQPFASKVFANEILHGAPHSGDYLKDQVRAWVEAKSKVIEFWVKRGLMRPVEPRHLFFVIWAATRRFDAPVLHDLGSDPDLCRFRVPDPGRAEAPAPAERGLLGGMRADHPHGAERLRPGGQIRAAARGARRPTNLTKWTV